MRNEDENNQDVEWAWVDYVEGDVEPEMKQDLQNLLRLSSDSREVVSDLHWTKEMVKSLDPAHDEFLEKWDAKANLEKILEKCQTPAKPSPNVGIDWKLTGLQWTDENSWQAPKPKSRV
jgi:hypothetical protein